MRILSTKALGGLFAALTTLALTTAQPATAHVILSQPHAPSGAHYTAFLRVGHGCDGSATVAIRVEIPAEVRMARPQPKPGWTLAIEHVRLAQPERGEGGRPVEERVSAITWRGGPLPDDEWDDFGLAAKLPPRTGPLYFPVVQTCERGEARWTDIPAPGQRTAHPAPVVTLDPAAAGEDMAGMKMGG